ncbi:hypothetical protein LXA43DRAFT_1118589 [Ganoderma leucocontextum]|nr:hypothetical protein LXA43DRAFT_1118589 [Ganoderma leucocontextum]
MSPSGSSTHAFAKRDMVLGPPLIAGIVVVAVGFILVIALSWCVFRQRKKLKEAKSRKARISAPIDCEKYETSAAFASSTKASPAAVPLKTMRDAHRAPTGGISYYELIRSLQPTIQPPTPSRSSPTRLSPGSPRGSTDSAKLKHFILRPQDMKNLDGVSYYPKTKHRHATRRSAHLGIPARGGQRRPYSISAETASVYSAASAPLDFHEHLSRTRSTFTLEPIPASAPPWVTNLPKPPAPAILTDTTVMEFEIPFPSPRTSTTSECSEAIVEKPMRSLNAFSPIALPNASTPSLVHARANSNPSTPPQIRWLTKGTAKDAANDTAPSPTLSKRPNSISSISTLFSLHENARPPPVPTVTVAPLNVQRRPNEGWVDVTRGAAPLVSPTVRPSTAPAAAQGGAPPVVPKRSSKRPQAPPPPSRVTFESW